GRSALGRGRGRRVTAISLNCGGKGFRYLGLELPADGNALTRIAASILAALVLVLAATAARAHPHVFIDARAEIVFDAEGRVAAIRHVWQFDEGFSIYATQGLDEDGDGKLSDAELA